MKKNQCSIWKYVRRLLSETSTLFVQHHGSTDRVRLGMKGEREEEEKEEEGSGGKR